MIQRKFLIVGLDEVNDKIDIKLTNLMETTIRPEEHIQQLPKTEEERIALRMGEVMMKTIVRLSPIPSPIAKRTTLPLHLLLTREEYEAIKRPTIHDILILKMEISVEEGNI